MEPKREVKWLGSHECDICGSDCRSGSGVLWDARIPAFGQWGVLCGECAEAYGVRAGIGRGQRYAWRRERGGFVKVEG